MAGGRIVFADPSALKHLGVAFAECGESCGEFAALTIAHRRRARANRVAVDDSELLERSLDRRDRWAIRLGAALERARDAKFLDRVGIQAHQLDVAGAVDL